MSFTDAELLAAYPRIYSFAVSMVRDRTYAKDITQETVIRMLRHRKKYRPQEVGLASWGCKIAQNWFRSERSLLRSKIEVTESGLPVGPRRENASYRACDDPQKRIELDECLEFLWACNGSGEALLMLAFGDSHKEIALTQGVAVNTVKTRIIRTRERLEQRFGVERTTRRSGQRSVKRR